MKRRTSKGMKSFILVWVLGLLISSSALSADINIAARAYRSCSYYSSSSADFRIQYQNNDVPEGSRVRMVYGFHDRVHEQYWPQQGDFILNRAGNNQWRVEFSGKQVDSRGSFYYDELDFAFEIQAPNGAITWDNGGRSPMGYYFAPIPERVCNGENEEYQVLVIDRRG